MLVPAPVIAAPSKSDRTDLGSWPYQSGTTGTPTVVRTDDGASIAVWMLGRGPGLVTVPGSIADHNTVDSLIFALAPDVTVSAMDRRGCGGSPDTPGYSTDREFDDVALVVDTCAARTGGPVSVWGLSYGPTERTAPGRRDPHPQRRPPDPLRAQPGPALSAGFHEAFESAPAGGDHDAAITAVLGRRAGVDRRRVRPVPSEPVIARPARRRTHHPAGTPGRAALGIPARPVDAITAPTLVLTGADSEPVVRPGDLASAAIHDARIHVLDRHAHFAHKTDPDMVAEIVE